MNIYEKQTTPEVDSDILVDELEEKAASVVVFNDDHNSFEHVINVFQMFCGHTTEQAEQCAWIIHNKGKCNVKRGAKDEMTKICSALCENGLTAEVQED